MGKSIRARRNGYAMMPRKRKMKIRFLLPAVVATLSVAAIAQAQGLLMPWLNDITPLSDQDRAIIRSTVQQQIHGAPPGTIANWSNPAGGHKGRITLVSKS